MTIEEAISRYHWFQRGEDGVIELFLDHHALATFRSCEASFELSMMANIRPIHKSWNLEFGIIFHKMIEEFYLAKWDERFELVSWLQLAIGLWDKFAMEAQFGEHKMYKMLGGVYGFIDMLAQYADHFAAEVDRLRVIGIEITFGKKREVPLGTFAAYQLDPTLQPHFKIGFDAQVEPVRCYLTGRIDFLMDSGNAIGPLDHKTTAFFRGNPANTYDPQEGMTGYIFAVQNIMKKSFPELLGQRKVDRIWMNFAQVSPVKDPMERFKRVPMFKTDWQLEQYRLRQLRTFHKIYDMIVLGERADWNTSVCNKMFHNECQYRNLHRQNTNDAMIQVLKTDFKVAAPWNPECVED
jgi:hypothetical protein